MNKAIISLSFNKINSSEDIDSISSIFLLINKIEEGNSNLHFEKILIAHDEYRVESGRVDEAKKVLNEMETLKQDKFFKTRKVYPENLKPFLGSLLEGFEQIYIIYGFSNINDMSNSIKWISDIFPGDNVHVFNTLEKSYGESEIEICHHNLNKFLDYIS